MQRSTNGKERGKKKLIQRNKEAIIIKEERWFPPGEEIRGARRRSTTCWSGCVQGDGAVAPRALRGTKKRLSLRSPYGEPRTDVNVCGATLIAALSQPRPLSRMPTHPRLCNGRPPLRNTGPPWPFILTLSGPFVQSVSRRALSAAGSLWGRAWFYRFRAIICRRQEVVKGVRGYFSRGGAGEKFPSPIDFIR